jgi:hypothetical protein
VELPSPSSPYMTVTSLKSMQRGNEKSPLNTPNIIPNTEQIMLPHPPAFHSTTTPIITHPSIPILTNHPPPPISLKIPSSYLTAGQDSPVPCCHFRYSNRSSPTGAEPWMPSYLSIIRSQVQEILSHIHRQVLFSINHECHQLRD